MSNGFNRINLTTGVNVTEFEHKFEYQWGGVDTPFTKMKRWAKKQNPIIQHLALGFIKWLWQKWVDGRVNMEMASVDKQAEEIKKQWENDDPDPWVVDSSPSEVEGLDNISISWRNHEREDHISNIRKDE